MPSGWPTLVHVITFKKRTARSPRASSGRPSPARCRAPGSTDSRSVALLSGSAMTSSVQVLGSSPTASRLSGGSWSGRGLPRLTIVNFSLRGEVFQLSNRPRRAHRLPVSPAACSGVRLECGSSRCPKLQEKPPRDFDVFAGHRQHSWTWHGQLPRTWVLRASSGPRLQLVLATSASPTRLSNSSRHR